MLFPLLIASNIFNEREMLNDSNARHGDDFARTKKGAAEWLYTEETKAKNATWMRERFIHTVFVKCRCNGYVYKNRLVQIGPIAKWNRLMCVYFLLGLFCMFG